MNLNQWFAKRKPVTAVDKNAGNAFERKRTARTVLTNEGYLVGRTVCHGNSSLTRFIGQSAITSRT